MIKPVGKRVLVRRDEPVKQVGRIIIPDEAQKNAPSVPAEVIDVGPGCEILRKGQRVLVGKFSGTDIEINGVQYIILDDEDDAIAVIGGK